jgi:hypothetical protein
MCNPIDRRIDNMKIMTRYTLLLGTAYIVSSLIYLIESMARVKISVPQLLPSDVGMVFYFMTVGVLYNYAWIKSREEVSNASLFIALLMSVAIMLVEVVDFIISSIDLLISSTRAEIIYNIMRIEVILGILSIPLLLKMRKVIYE